MLLNFSKIKQIRSGIRFHCKGLGVFCKKREGIKKNQIVTTYFGEVYPSWYWGIKQQVIKEFLQKVKKDKLKKFREFKNNYNVDFYNILVEKHENEPNGREVFVIDPIINGNFASRLSHSCDPNCWAIPVISRGQYQIALYAIKDIDFNEELTFDYCSFTESEEEWQNSICLCGVEECRMFFLNYNKQHETFFQNDIKRNLLDNPEKIFQMNMSIALKASQQCKITQKMQHLLDEYKLGKNLFKKNSPMWLKSWAYYQLEAIENEKTFLEESLQREKLS